MDNCKNTAVRLVILKINTDMFGRGNRTRTKKNVRVRQMPSISVMFTSSCFCFFIVCYNQSDPVWHVHVLDDVGLVILMVDLVK